jgi:dolichyl-phosphate beta-glucosyltransferase
MQLATHHGAQQGTPPGATLVVPCFNEERRLDEARVRAFAERPGISLLLVDDGSTDGTRAVLERMAGSSPHIAALALPRNRGKAEAVRQGLLRAIDDGAVLLGYYDADLATPPEEMERIVSALRDDAGLHFAMGARVSFLGTRIERRRSRHYLGRIFATLASMMLRLPVYDTQCGAKALRSSPALRAALAQPFRSRWAFDVELIGRLLAGAPGVPALTKEAFRELPLAAWRDVKGSKVAPAQMVWVLAELALIHRDLVARRAAARR